MTSEQLQRARARLVSEIRKAARSAAEFECSANSYDQPIAETPWLRNQRYGDDKYDARWYAVQGVLTHFNEGLEGRIADALDVYAAIASVDV